MYNTVFMMMWDLGKGQTDFYNEYIETVIVKRLVCSDNQPISDTPGSLEPDRTPEFTQLSCRIMY